MLSKFLFTPHSRPKCNKSILNFFYNGTTIVNLTSVGLSIARTLTTSASKTWISGAEDEGPPKNEPILDYRGDTKSSHRLELERCLADLHKQVQDVPIIIKGKEHRTNDVRYQKVPFDHKNHVAQFYYATPELILKAISVALEARNEWDRFDFVTRFKLFNRAADLVAGKYRQRLNAATMMGQGKTIEQAEIDSAAELADFLRFNAHYMRKLLHWSQPLSSSSSLVDERNSVEFRGLDGFVAAISPFNFTAIGGNLASAPALAGNCVIWKPSDTAVLANYITMQVFQEAGFPDGVINFVPCEGFDFGRLITGNDQLGGINFTGSLITFQWLWSEVGANIKRFRTFPRLIGECGGKNFHLIHPSADLEVAVAQTLRSAFEYSGQKCSACSRLYVPESLWTNGGVRDQLINRVKEQVKVGAATDFSAYTSAVIDSNAFRRISNYINYAKASESGLKLLCGGQSDDQLGYFIQPTILESSNPQSLLMREEIFGPVLSVYVYPDAELEKTLDEIGAIPFALTGAIFAQDENFIIHARKRLRMCAGNLYINDKSTGAVVGQQPFGGAKLSGTNDKAGGPHYLMRWCNQQTIKRTTQRSKM